VGGQRPHVVGDHVALLVVERKQLRCIEESHLRVTGAVPSLTLDGVVLLAVVEEQVVEYPGACRRARVQMELPAEEKVIIGNVHAVLEPRCALMVGESAELLYCGIVQQIADAVEVFRHIVNLSA